MTRDEILALLERRAEAWRRLDVGTLVTDYAADAVIESPLAGGTTHGVEQITQVFQTYFVAFPDLGMDVGEVLVDDQRAAVMATFYEFKDGKIVRDRRVYDFTGLLIQVGTLKAKPA